MIGTSVLEVCEMILSLGSWENWVDNDGLEDVMREDENERQIREHLPTYFIYSTLRTHPSHFSPHMVGVVV